MSANRAHSSTKTLVASGMTLVGDDLVTARLLRALLDSWGFEVVTADEQVVEPADPEELRSRLEAGIRVLAMEHHFERAPACDVSAGYR